MKPIDKKIYDVVVEKKKQLMGLPPEDLRSLSEYSSIEFEALGKTQLLSIYHHLTEKKEDLFVVQCKRAVFLGFGYMFAEGFVLNYAGQLREAEEKLLWDYR